MTQKQALETRTEKALKQSASDFYRARQSWSLFISSNGPFDSPKRSLHEIVNKANLGFSFNAIQNLSISDCILSICRLTDSVSDDRLNICLLRRDMEKHRNLFLENAEAFFADPGNLIHGRSCQVELLRYCGQFIYTLTLIDEFIASRSLKTIRSHRNKVLAHSLKSKADVPKVSDVEDALTAAGKVIAALYLVLQHSTLVVDELESQYLRKFDKFWDAVELGAQEQPKRQAQKFQEMLQRAQKT
ncbi:AbiU2 domain-containing protein [Henriciella mobilis]|nr:hypothetical protein [Henriciella mobilis]RIJ14778.1 hypothetical protein D1231_14210 [Henriciella mobilis]RIJ21734.1 hypothetical protein D1227_09350 [Henriciella mobilis]